MVSNLIKTKIGIPPLRAELVSRPGLIKRLKNGLTCPLTLVSAPAGYGKTTLLAELAVELPLAWLSLDEGDNNPVRFWTHFTAALQTRQTYLGEAVLHTLGSLGQPPVRSLLIEIINELSAGNPSAEPYIIVCDDYHLIKEPDIHKDITFLLEHLPPQLRLVISTRSDPPLPLARMRARGQLSEFRARDLRFSLKETEIILNSIANLGLSRTDIEALDARTEGWIASLQMAAISMKNRTNITAFISDFTGTHRYVLDYLTEEVLSRQTESTRSFLIETSVLDHLNGALCDAVTGRTDGMEMLAQLDNANLFVVPLDDERRWYRYHHLFASLLLNQLKQQPTEKVRELQLKAAGWYRHNNSEEAITYAMAAGDFDLAAQFIESMCGMYMIQSEYQTLLNLLAKIPEKIFLKYPMLAVLYASMYSNMGKIDLAENWLKLTEGRSLSPVGQAVNQLSTIYVAIARQDDRKANMLLETLTRDKGITFSLKLNTEEAGVVVLRIFPWHILSHLQKTHGNLELAIETCRAALDNFSNISFTPPFSVISALLNITMAELLYERNDLEKALSHAVTGINIANQVGIMSVQAYGAAVLEIIQQALSGNSVKNDYKESQTIISRNSWVDTKKYLCYPTHSLPLLLRTRYTQGDFTAAQECIKTFERIADLDQWRTLALSWPGDSIDIAVAYSHLAAGKFNEAEVLLKSLQEKNEKVERKGNLIEILLMRSLVLQATGNVTQAVGLVGKALTLAEPEGYIRIFLDLGTPMVSLLKEAAEQNTAPHYVHRLLAEFEKGKHRTMQLVSPLIEPLTVRELEVLNLLAEDQSNLEIAQKLFLTLGTVKTHAHNIYAKLGVRNRTQAVKRAINLNLI